MTYLALIIAVALPSASLGAYGALLLVKPRLDQLKRLTDRDELGRFKGGKP